GQALRYWARLGFVNFGGPAGQIAMMHRDLVERRRWICEERFLRALNFCMLLPGPEAQQLAIYIGWLLHRTAGGVAAGVLFVLPSVFVLLGLSYVYAAFGSVAAVAAVFTGLRAVVVAIVVAAVLRIGRKAIRTPLAGAIAAAGFAAIYFLGVPFPAVVLGAGLVGLAAERLGLGGPPPPAAKEASVIGDDAPPPPHTQPSPRRALRVIAAGATLWAGPLLALGLLRGWQSLHVSLYSFFTKAAFVTFGGAYAVLAYVTQAAVQSLHWISHEQAVAGLGLAETTPGPLIMVLQFVGYMAGWNHPEGMTPAGSAAVGALATTWATFLPCFVLIFLGAPYIEVLRGNRRLAAALAGITAAVVGVILNLALVFGAAVVFPRGPAGGVELFALCVGGAALAALALFEVDDHWVIAAGAAAGLLRALL
ncbi:MAG: chromate efflux transporter, partial [Thermoanaerobaculia bacterium]